MYDFPIALRRFHGLVRWAARRWEIRGNSKLSREDLEQEGLLVLSECCESFPENQFWFARYFKRSLYNRLNELLRTELRKKRRGILVPLSDTVVNPQSLMPRYLDDDTHYFINTKLSPTTAKFVSEILEPGKEATEIAWKEFCRRNKLASQGQRVTGYKKFRIKRKHVRAAMGISNEGARFAMREVRRKYKKFKITRRKYR